MRRSTARTPRISTASGRRSAAARPRARVASSRRTRPRPLTPTQVREALAIVLIGAALLAATAELFTAGSLLLGLRAAITAGFGVGWPLPTLAGLALGLFLIWPNPPRLRRGDLGAGLLGALCLFGMLDLASGAGGGSGRAIDDLLKSLVGVYGSAIILVCGLLVGLIVAFHFSPGAILLGVAHAGQAAYAERRRLEGLVRVATPKPARREAAELKTALATTASAAATAPVPVETLPPIDAPTWLQELERELPELEPVAAVGADPAPPPRRPEPAPVINVVADPEDEPPLVDWKLPPISLLDSVTARKERMQDEIKRNVRIIESTLGTFGVAAKVIGVNPGPAVTQYELQPAPGIQVKRIVSLNNDLSLALAASPIRIEAPIPGKSAVGIEVPNKSASLVSAKEVLDSAAFKVGSQRLALALGNDVTGQAIVGDLTRMPHLLIAGATGQGKSVCINVLIASLLYQCTPEQLRLVMVDPKRVELSNYNGLPHLAIPVIVEPHQAASALRWAVAEMDRRYKLLSGEGVRNIQGYNDKARIQNARELPFVVIIIDELADLMMVAAGEIEELVCRIAQLARAVGIHLVIATQSPRTDIITGLIKANIPSRIAFAVSNQIDSRVILDSVGAEKLLGRGDMLYQPVDAGKPARIQGAFISDNEVNKLVAFWKDQGEPRYMEDVLDAGGGGDHSGEAGSDRKLDPLFARAARAVAAEGSASVSLVQRKFNVGYSRAGRLVDQLAEHRVVGAYQGSKSREVLMNLPDVDELLERLGLE